MYPTTSYAKSGDVSIAYATLGEGPFDLVLIPGFVSHLDLGWDNPRYARFMRRLATFSRVILFDKRGTGLSDRMTDAPTLEQRMDDVRAVMDAVGSTEAAIFGWSEGAPMAILFAATYPERTRALVLSGALARAVADVDYPWANTPEALDEAMNELIAPLWGQGALVEIFAPSHADDPQAREWTARMERQGASPGALAALGQMFIKIDVRPVLPSVRVPTLVIHRRGDRVVNWRAGQYVANHIPGARFVLFPGVDHGPWYGESDPILDEIEEFLTGSSRGPEPETILATVLFTDIVASTERAAAMGDRRWRDLLETHHQLVRQLLQRFRGREVKALGDGFLATFDGPARCIRCAGAICSEALRLGIEVRAGLHTGEVEVIDGDIGGITVHIAARVCTNAGASEVLVSRTVKDLVAGSGITFDSRGTHTLKGVPDSWELFAARDVVDLRSESGDMIGSHVSEGRA
ncbi:MAG: adenylate/guanylate cyclase domain-containing protein [Actinomycetota bacterium]